MVLAWENKEIRSICEDTDIAHAKLGSALAISLQTRLSELIAADNITDLPVGDPTEIEYSCCKIDLIDDRRLIFCSNHVNTPLLQGKINWSQVTRIKILKLENTNV